MLKTKQKQNKVFVYCDFIKTTGYLENIVGSRSLGQIIFENKFIYKILKEVVLQVGFTKFIYITEISELFNTIESNKKSSSITLLNSRFLPKSLIKFSKTLKKFLFTSQDLFWGYEEWVLASLNRNDDVIYCQNKISTYERNSKLKFNLDKFFNMSLSESVFDLTRIEDILSMNSISTKPRYFNKMYDSKYIVRKVSQQKNKIKSEYNYYYLLPSDIQHWFVQPFDYKENKVFAEYSMEKFLLPDCSFYWIHSTFSESNFDHFLEKIFIYLKKRPMKKSSKKQGKEIAESTYLKKVLDRFQKFKEWDGYNKISQIIRSQTKYSMDKLIEEYEQTYMKISKKRHDFNLVVGHGDLCFSNILFDNHSFLVKFIDPKGANNEQELWMDEYYDLAKLSHSILGNYDFINRKMFDILLDSNNNIYLSLHTFSPKECKSNFICFLNYNGYSIELVRLYELSLFLSMLSLHTDYPNKVLALILNSIQILEKINT